MGTGDRGEGDDLLEADAATQPLPWGRARAGGLPPPPSTLPPPPVAPLSSHCGCGGGRVANGGTRGRLPRRNHGLAMLPPPDTHKPTPSLPLHPHRPTMPGEPETFAFQAEINQLMR